MSWLIAESNLSKPRARDKPLRSAVYPLLLLLSVVGCGAKAPYEGKSVAELQRMLHDPSPAVKAQGAFGLGRLGPEARDAVPALIAALKQETIVRQNAALALGQIGSAAREAVPALVDALGDSEWSVRRQAALALGQIGPEARAAVPGLKKLSNDPDKLVRKAAEEALKKIQHAVRPSVDLGGSKQPQASHTMPARETRCHEFAVHQVQTKEEAAIQASGVLSVHNAELSGFSVALSLKSSASRGVRAEAGPSLGPDPS